MVFEGGKEQRNARNKERKPSHVMQEEEEGVEVIENLALGLLDGKRDVKRFQGVN